MSYRVLIVEDEATLLAALVRGLSSMDGVEVHGCASAEEALESLSRSVPDLAILDINLPGVSGLDLIEDLTERRPPVPIVVSTAYAHVHRDRLELHPELQILEKPVPLEELRRIIAEHSAGIAETRDSGPFQVADYLQLASLGRHTVALAVEGEELGDGRIEIVEGEVWNARCDELAGEQALDRLVTRRARHIRCLPLVAPGQRQIVGRSETLLLEIARRHDEAGRGTQAADGGAGPPGGEAEPPPADGYEELFGSAMQAYLERRYDRALELLEACRELRPDDGRTAHNIARIRARRGPR